MTFRLIAEPLRSYPPDPFRWCIDLHCELDKDVFCSLTFFQYGGEWDCDGAETTHELLIEIYEPQNPLELPDCRGSRLFTYHWDFSYSMRNPSVLMINPRNHTFDIWNSHFSPYIEMVLKVGKLALILHERHGIIWKGNISIYCQYKQWWIFPACHAAHNWLDIGKLLECKKAYMTLYNTPRSQRLC